MTAVRRLCILGGESSGKTTLAMQIAAALGTPWVPEYGRELWERLRRTLDVDELVQVAERQVALEDDAARRVPARAGWLVCDTSPLTTLQYCLHDHGRAPPRLHELARRRYNLAVLCEPDFAFVQDGCRRDQTFRAAQHAWTLGRLAELDAPLHRACGAPAVRLRALLRRIGAYSASHRGDEP
jgi:NadR type nicotinamide-nucleotide adenylyltransferase